MLGFSALGRAHHQRIGLVHADQAQHFAGKQKGVARREPFDEIFLDLPEPPAGHQRRAARRSLARPAAPARRRDAPGARRASPIRRSRRHSCGAAAPRPHCARANGRVANPARCGDSDHRSAARNRPSRRDRGAIELRAGERRHKARWTPLLAYNSSASNGSPQAQPIMCCARQSSPPTRADRRRRARPRPPLLARQRHSSTSKRLLGASSARDGSSSR